MTLRYLAIIESKNFANIIIPFDTEKKISAKKILFISIAQMKNGSAQRLRDLLSALLVNSRARIYTSDSKVITFNLYFVLLLLDYRLLKLWWLEINMALNL